MGEATPAAHPRAGAENPLLPAVRSRAAPQTAHWLLPAAAAATGLPPTHPPDQQQPPTPPPTPPFRELAEESGIEHWGRVPALNTNPTFIDDLADAVTEALPYVSSLARSSASLGASLSADSLVPLGELAPPCCSLPCLLYSSLRAQLQQPPGRPPPPLDLLGGLRCGWRAQLPARVRGRPAGGRARGAGAPLQVHPPASCVRLHF